MKENVYYDVSICKISWWNRSSFFKYIYIDNEQKCIDVHFERPTKDGFDSVRIKLPTYEVTVWEGNYTDEEIEFFKQVVKNSCDLFYKYVK